jgi:hypothetical protein
MSNDFEQTKGLIAANMYLGLEVATRLIDVLVAKEVLSKAEAGATLLSIGDGIRKDADQDENSRPAVEALARSLERSAERYQDQRGER